MAELEERYGFGLRADAAPIVLFLVARRDGQTLGCGGLLHLTRDAAELKQLVLAEGDATGRLLTEALENAAWILGYRRIRLEVSGAHAMGWLRRGYRARLASVRAEPGAASPSLRLPPFRRPPDGQAGPAPCSPKIR
jgi:hypothetical protein